MKINKLLTPYNFTDKNDTSRIKYVVIHYVGALGDAEANCRYYASKYIGASAHYYVGFDGSVYQSVEDEDIAWHCGAKSYVHPEARNSNSIGIEMCVRKKDTKSQGAEDKDWYFEDATVQAAAELTRELMKKYGVPADRVIRHYDVTGKICPNPYVYNQGAHTWEEFKKLLEGQASDEDDTSGYMKITGKAKATAEQMREYLQKVYPGTPETVSVLPELYLKEGSTENIRGDIAFAQSLLETGNFKFDDGTAVTFDQSNFCGMGVTAKGEKGNSFDSPELGIRAQVQHLKAYANKAELKSECVDPRFQYVERGCSPYVEWLGQKENPKGKGWASGEGYGKKILSILSKIMDKEEDGSQEQSDQAGNGGQIRELKGSLEVIYKGSDGLNVRTAPCIEDNVNQVVHDGVYIVTGISEDGEWYRLRSGLYISSNEKYVKFIPAWQVKVTATALNIRPLPGTGKSATGCIRDQGVYTIVRNVNGWGMLYSGAGYIKLSYTRQLS